MMADSDNILQDDYIGDLDMDADEEDALLEKGFENRHSIFLDEDGAKVHRYNFDDEEEEDILDIGVTEDLSLIESEHLSDYSAVVEKSSQRIVEAKKPTQTIVSSVSSSGTPEGSIAENVPSSTSGVEEISTPTEKDDSSRFKAAKKIVISNTQSSAAPGPTVRPNFQLFTKELRNRRENLNVRKRLGGNMRQGNARLRHPHPRFGNDRMMGPPPFRSQGLMMRAPGPPRQAGPPPSQQRSPGPWPRKILINPHFNQNQQNRNQQWGGQNQNQNQPPPRFQQQPPQQPQWQQPPSHQQPPQPHQIPPQPQQHPPQPHQHPPQPQHHQHQPPRQQGPQPRFRHVPPPQEYEQQREQYPPPSHVITPEPQPFYQQNYRPEYGSYQESGNQALPLPASQPPHVYGAPQTPPTAPPSYQQGYYQQYPDTRPPPQQSYDMQPMTSGSPYDAPRQPQPPHAMGPSDMEVMPLQPAHGAYIEQPPPHQNYPPPQAHYGETPMNQQYAPPPRPYEDPNQFNPSRPPPLDTFHQPLPSTQYRPEYNRPQVVSNPMAMGDRTQYAADPNQSYALSQGPPRYEEERPPMFTQQSNSGYQPEPRQPQMNFSPSERPSVQPSRGNIKSRLGARVSLSPQGSSVQFVGMKNKRNLSATPSGGSQPIAAKQPRYESLSPSKKVQSRNILQVPTIQTLPNLPDTTSSEKDAIGDEEEDEEMREYKKKIEAQKQFREKIFQIKEARRKQAVLQQSKATKAPSETPNPALKPVQSRSVQPIATIVGAGAGKRQMPSGPSNVLAKRKARFRSQGGPVSSRSDIVDTGSSEPAKTTTTLPRTLDERFSGLKSGVLVQPHEEKFTSSSNRTVLPAMGSVPLDPNASNIVIIDNLSASTKAQQLVDIASQCGKLAELNLKQSQKQAVLKFKTAVGAAEFFKKYQRKMIDLSMITLTMG